MKFPAELTPVFNALKEAGGRGFFVGGCVRDHLLKKACDDLDITVEGLSFETLTDTLRPFATRLSNPVGANFSVVTGVFFGEELDFALCRSENSTGVGHGDFSVCTKGVTLLEDLARRDLTVNAVAFDPLTGVFVDPFNGMGALKVGKLEAPTAAFAEDPLRVLRVGRFAARFGFEATEELKAMCRTLDFNDLSPERVSLELGKLFKSENVDTNAFFRFLEDVNWTGAVGLEGLRLPETRTTKLSRLSSLLEFAGADALRVSKRLKLNSAFGSGVCERLVGVLRELRRDSDTFTFRRGVRRAQKAANGLLEELLPEVFPEDPGFVSRVCEVLPEMPRAVRAADLMGLGLKGRELGLALSKALDLQDSGMSRDEVLAHF